MDLINSNAEKGSYLPLVACFLSRCASVTLVLCRKSSRLFDCTGLNCAGCSGLLSLMGPAWLLGLPSCQSAAQPWSVAFALPASEACAFSCVAELAISKSKKWRYLGLSDPDSSAFSRKVVIGMQS